ncbi:MAG: cell wall hydrolase [Rickettsiales bacterium]|nr:cell wall hydrolase [Rickettsiales bacterium]
MATGLYTARNASALARALFATQKDAPPILRLAIAHAAVNRYLYERDLDPGADFVSVVADEELFECWGDPRSFSECTGDARYGECFAAAKGVLSGGLGDPTNCSRRFHARFRSPVWAIGLVPAARIGGYLFYNNCD